MLFQVAFWLMRRNLIFAACFKGEAEAGKPLAEVVGNFLVEQIAVNQPNGLVGQEKQAAFVVAADGKALLYFFQR